jgi:hypothetical protein
MGKRRGAYRVLVRKPEGKKPLGRPGLRCDDNTEMNLQKGGLDGLEWIDLAQDKDGTRALVNAVMNHSTI